MKKTFFFYVLLFSFGGLLFTPLLSAKDKPPTTATKVGDRFYQKKTVYDFSSDTIAGDLTRPDGEYIESRRGIKHKRLIKLRQNWKKKMRQSIDEL